MFFDTLLSTQGRDICRQNIGQAAESSDKLSRKRLYIFLWNRIGQKKFKQLLVSISSFISSDEVSFEPLSMTSLAFNFYLHSSYLLQSGFFIYTCCPCLYTAGFTI